MINKVLGTILRFILTRMSKGRLPQIDGTLKLPGLESTVEVIRDKYGIPHIYARNEHDLFYAQGFVTAQDRFFQMELNRRTATGKLGEVFGDIALDTDRVSRTFGFARIGQEDWDNADEDLKAIFQAYSDGVNAFLEQGKLPVEFSLLRYKPELWDPLDSAAFSRVMIWQLSHAWYGEIVRAKLVEAVGAERAAELEIHYPEKNPITLPEGIEFNKLSAKGLIKQATGPFLDQGKGSNTWTVSGEKSVTGKPFLCNDMHLQLMMPSLWYECHLSAGDYNVTGVTLPGIPLVMVGHNASIAWGMTLSYMDIEDLFIEKMNPENPHQYEYHGEWVNAEVIEETIAVKGRDEPHIEEILMTKHGPVISEAIGYSKEKLADCSMALRSNKAFKGWLLLNKTSSWNEFVEAMSCIDAPALNVSYADTAGNTGYWVSGKVPVRGKGDGSVPAPGWTGEYDWTGFIPFEEMPHALNPEKGFLVNTNHKIVPESYKHFLGNIWMNGYRARRIGEVFGCK
ncbi:MAG: penicillin acylase family protein, partial [Candidatus Odinarchaeota archaeon]